jgi:aminopeptidase YwaD
LNVRSEVTTQNVVARPPSGVCRTLSGGHYDSVPWADGATDNASGSAVVLELARAAAVAGLDDACFALFGAEEVGLQGSAFFVAEMTPEERDALEAMYNFDVVAGRGAVALIGDAALIESADTLSGELGISAAPSRLPENSGSDHLSFLDVHIPALMFSASGGPPIHTPEDNVANLVPDTLGPVARLAFALLERDLPPRPQ